MSSARNGSFEQLTDVMAFSNTIFESTAIREAVAHQEQQVLILHSYRIIEAHSIPTWHVCSDVSMK